MVHARTLALACGLSLVALYTSAGLKLLPWPARDIPADLSPPLVPDGRSDVHGWLWLPIDAGAVRGADAGTSAVLVSSLHGYFYHHTPEFWHSSPHDFEIMLTGTLALDRPVAGLPLPGAGSNVLGTEYVFTPPAFSLNDLITGSATSFYGHFTNGSFDTKQKYDLSNGTLTVEELTTVRYLPELNHTEMPTQAYLSYPRAPAAAAAGAAASGEHSLYWLHALHSMPDYDQIVHVTINLDSCVWRHGDTAADALDVGATFGTSLPNDVLHRLHEGQLTATLFTQRSKGVVGPKTTCAVSVLEEVHCVVMPDSFAKCPALGARTVGLPLLA